jgi:hypothetical protein
VARACIALSLALALGRRARADAAAAADAPPRVTIAPATPVAPATTSARPDSTPGSGSGVVEIGPQGIVPPATPPPASGGAAGETKATETRVPAANPLSGFDAPHWVMLRSLVVPGWGQLHNGSWIKALGVATGEGILIARIIDDNQALNDLNAQIDAARANGDANAEAVAIEAYNSRLNDLNSRAWLLGGVVAYALLDAYIDAHFRNFDIEFKRDPALPGGVPPPPGKKSGLMTAGETRLALRWSF